MRDHRRRQRNLFDEVDASHLPPLEEAVKQTVALLLVQWMQALAKAIQGEVDDDRDQR